VRFESLLRVVGDEPVFPTGLLLAGALSRSDVERQLSRWVSVGRLWQLRRGWYALAPPYQRVKPHPFAVANRLVAGSYVSGQSALAHLGLIPEHVPVVTSVASARPARWQTPLGTFVFQHRKPSAIHGFRLVDLGAGQKGFVATAEKALLDLVALTPGADAPRYLRELRLQGLEHLDVAALSRLADRARSPKLRRAADTIAALARQESEEYEPL